MKNKLQAKLLREKANLEKNPIEGIQVKWSEDNLNILSTIQGPIGSFYEGGTFQLEIQISNSYPVEPPRVTMNTKIIHPNIDTDGAVCIACLRKWHHQGVGIRNILEEVQHALANPSTIDPLNANAANLLRTDPEEFKYQVINQIQLSKIDGN